MPEYTAYRAEREGKFVIEWYFNDLGESESLEYYKSLNVEYRAKTMSLFERMAIRGEIRDKTKFRNEGDKIFAFKPAPDRFLCFFTVDKKIIITNAYHKKTDKLPAREKNLAIKRKNDYENRTKKKTYYR